MKMPLFKIGLVMLIVGMTWTALIFHEAEKKSDSVILKQSSSFETQIKVSSTDIGYFKLYMPEFAREKIFVQILDPNENIIQEEMVQTKMSVGYFDFNGDGQYTMKITNIQKNPINIQMEFGNTNSQKMHLSGILILVGAITIMVMSYWKIKNYNIEHPEENIS